MAQFEITDLLLKAKRDRKLTYTQLGQALGRDKVWVAALVYGQARASQDEAEKLLNLLDLDTDLAEFLTDFPLKGSLVETVPTDPLIYRFFEVMQVYGMPMKDVIQEEFGDGIMSAIDFTLTIDKVEDPKGDRVKVTYEGKFLSYKKW
ncbi:cyanase [Anthocerotibacter panamensis]|uniref:cyanase n=1 Tax=Anthocerotibacter panamensis TaxID=2857077 RepID=UPI001C4042EF|nr:cyanase [Anthocerotibacter panamensis]